MSNHLPSQWILVLCLQAPLGKFSNGKKKNNLPHLASLWHLQSLSTSSRTLPASCGVTFCDQHELMLAPLLDLMTVELRMTWPYIALPSLAGNKKLVCRISVTNYGAHWRPQVEVITRLSAGAEASIVPWYCTFIIIINYHYYYFLNIIREWWTIFSVLRWDYVWTSTDQTPFHLQVVGSSPV